MHIHGDSFEAIHLLLAYSGMAVHTAIQMQKAFNRHKSNFRVTKFLRYNMFHLIADLIAIPMLLLVFTDESMKALFPINYVTAVFTGYTAQSILQSIFKMKKG